ncbi:hypothetical protein TSAR_008138 [Trichomalopsis sarcophagae]|uniref:Uncharacterized protein n=1 Tax=Trichomalopsis sarcophagae TaxID=543379 RepID=A0A232EUC9_9HYME|nr:hypothetical protein TSAR_008138 [Trichomalopsis sarcophagae]
MVHGSVEIIDLTMVFLQLLDKKVDKSLILKCFPHTVYSAIYMKIFMDLKGLQNGKNGSTDENPQHMYCPTGSGSWCKYQKALVEGKEQDYVHPPAIPKAILDEIEDVFKKLSEPELLRNCLGGQTQNANESFNNVLWNIAPKTDFVGLETLEITAYIAFGLAYSEV